MLSPTQNPDPGALPREKADNRPAALSEGEYVLPAEVVRFYGLEKIESMVTKAKESLGAMQEQGRMKNPPQQPARGGAGAPQAPQRGAGGPPMPSGPGASIARRGSAGAPRTMPGMADGGMVRTTLADGRTVFMPAGVNFRPGHTVLGGPSAMQQVAAAQEQGDAGTATSTGSTSQITDTGEGGESDPNTNTVGAPDFSDIDLATVADMAVNGFNVNSMQAQFGLTDEQTAALSGSVSPSRNGKVGGVKDLKDLDVRSRAALGLAGMMGLTDPTGVSMAGATDDSGTSGPAGSTSAQDHASGVGSGIEGGFGTTGGHDDGGEDSDSSEGSGTAGHGGMDGEFADGGFVGGMKLPPAVDFKKKTAKKR